MNAIILISLSSSPKMQPWGFTFVRAVALTPLTIRPDARNVKMNCLICSVKFGRLEQPEPRGRGRAEYSALWYRSWRVP